VAKLDVRSDADTAAVARQLEGDEVGLLVNNAGYAFFATQEEGSMEAFRDLLEVNVVGVARVTRALLPSIRASRGAVVQLASVAGRTVFPESGFYAATKHAVEALSEALLQETVTFGVRVRVVEPGSFDTGFLARAARESPSSGEESPYASLRPGWTARKAEVLEPPQSPALVVEAILRSMEDPAPFLRVPVGADAERILGLRDELGPHDWMRLAAHRSGAEAPGLPSPADVLAGRGVELARAACRAGHLRHWEESESGRRALSTLVE
jgi:NAD(P)-dependent dehydrogenase (short-subunit alcohol dehydrogenase family)